MINSLHFLAFSSKKKLGPRRFWAEASPGRYFLWIASLGDSRGSKKNMGQKNIGQKITRSGNYGAGGGPKWPLFGAGIIVFAKFYKVFLHFWGSIWAPSEEDPGSGKPWFDLVLVMTPFGAEIMVFARFYKGFLHFWGPFGPPPRMVNTQGWE